jgi:hypothetical protein
MSDTVLIVLIIAVVVVVVLLIFRKQVSRFFIKASKDGVEADLTTREPAAPSTTASGNPASVVISGNKQIGKEQKIDVARPDVAVQDNLQLGYDQEIKVKSDPKTPTTKQ